MTTLLLILTPIALLDSTSMIPVAVIPLAAMLGSTRPYVSSLSFLTGISVVYFAAGVALCVGLDALFASLSEPTSRWIHAPNTIELTVQIVVGTLMVGLGWKLADKRQGRSQDADAGELGIGANFMLGASLVIIGLPGALPYFGAVDQILRVHEDVGGALASLLFYNVVFLLPLSGLVILRALLPGRSAAIFQRIADVSARWGRRFFIAILVVLGLVLTADGVALLFGQPLIPYP